MWWGAHPSSLITIFRATIRSSIEYGTMVIPIMQNPLFKKLEIIQRRALRLALGLRNSSSNNSVLAEAKEPTPRFRSQFLSDKFLLKVFPTTWPPLLTSIIGIFSTCLSSELTLSTRNTKTSLLAIPPPSLILPRLFSSPLREFLRPWEGPSKIPKTATQTSMTILILFSPVPRYSSLTPPK